MMSWIGQAAQVIGSTTGIPKIPVPGFHSFLFVGQVFKGHHFPSFRQTFGTQFKHHQGCELNVYTIPGSCLATILSLRSTTNPAESRSKI